MSIKQIQHDAATNTTPVVPLHSPKKTSSANKTSRQYFEQQGNVQPLHKDTTLSCRYELKYRIPETTARAIAAYIQSYIPPDQYARKCRDQEYLISSLYFDSNDLHLCKETIEKKKNRFKLRVRCYDDKPETPCFFEIKRRLDRVIVKDRARLPKTAFGKAIETLYVPDEIYAKDKKALLQFQFYLRMLQARPVVLVRYMRQAFEGDSSNRVRITFDRELSFKTTHTPLIATNGAGWHRVPMDFVILEIKFTSRYPLWLSELVKVFDLKQTAMSKYVSSVQQSCSMGFCGPRCQFG